MLKNPDISSGAETTSAKGAEITYTEFGIGVSHYFMPVNAYFTLAILGVLDRVEYGDSKGDSEVGYGISISAGKEWWLANDWGIGFALFYNYGAADDQSSEQNPPTLSNSIIGIALSITYN